MLLLLKRLRDNGFVTIGSLTVDNLKFVTLEDTYREMKLYGETRIPAGEYDIKLMRTGPMYVKYKKKFEFHEGMLWLQNVPGFSYVYIHIGNYKEDTKGCILVGIQAEGENYISGSTAAYRKLYFYVLDAIKNGEKVKIKIEDHDRNNKGEG